MPSEVELLEGSVLPGAGAGRASFVVGDRLAGRWVAGRRFAEAVALTDRSLALQISAATLGWRGGVAHNPEVAGSNPAPLQVKVQVRGPFSLRGGRASGVDVGRMWAEAFCGRGRIGADGVVRLAREVGRGRSPGRSRASGDVST